MTLVRVQTIEFCDDFSGHVVSAGRHASRQEGDDMIGRFGTILHGMIEALDVWEWKTLMRME